MNDFELNSTNVTTVQFITEQTARLCELEAFLIELRLNQSDDQPSLDKTTVLLTKAIKAQQRIVESAILSLSESA